ncbi:hypothetical protein Tco_1241905, partial [Tanacetum coccineum]
YINDLFVVKDNIKNYRVRIVSTWCRTSMANNTLKYGVIVMDEHQEEDGHFGLENNVAYMTPLREHITVTYGWFVSVQGTWVHLLEEMIRHLQEDNAQMRARSEVEMQVEVQRQVESQLQEHIRQRELEANAREEAREREWQRKMDDINLMLKKFNDPRPPQ